MLRSVFQSGRRRTRASPAVQTSSSEPPSDDDSAPPSVHGESSTDSVVLESWADWIQRVTHEVEEWNDKLGIKSWLELQRRRKHQWAGHLARRTDGRWSFQMLDWQPEGGPRQGGLGPGRRQARPKKRWEDELNDHVRRLTGDETVHWRMFTGDREAWKEDEDIFAAGAR